MTLTNQHSQADPRIAEILSDELDPCYRRRVSTVMRWLPPSDDFTSSIIDIGCGRGFFIRYYMLLGQHTMTGIELDPVICRRAAELNSASTNASIFQGDAAMLPFASSSFSGAILSEVLEHVPDDEAVLREAFRVLRPGAIAAITVPHLNYPWSWDPINRTLEALHLSPIHHGPFAGIWAEHLRLYEIAGLRDVVQRAGFQIETECAMLRYCLPFSHNLIYGIGKPLLESGWLPASLTTAIDRQRRRGEASSGSRIADALRAILAVGERWNRDHEGFSVPSVNLCIKVHKPY
ncbi:MAG: methyltransferase domain-containing protein [Comamonadaceae bacterium]|nr:methyltransferase domain-containing protein [Comamonadaceae bacterium]